MKTIGMIGGMSWESTTVYYQLINAGIKNRLGGLHSAKIVMASVDFHDVELMMQQGDWAAISAYLSGTAGRVAAAGADYVESPYEMGAVSMAQRVIRPTVTSFLDFAFTYKRKDIQMEETPVGPSSKLADVTLQDSGIRQKYNLIIIAIKKTDGSMLFNPSF